MRRFGNGCAIALISILAGTASEAPAASGGPGGIDALAAAIDVERTLLEEDRSDHAALAGERNRIRAALAVAWQELDETLARVGGDLDVGAVAERIEAVFSLERERAEAVPKEREVVERIRERLRRMALLEERLAALQERTVEEAGPLTGRWAVVMLPSNQNGTFHLVQDGTLVSGTYTLDGGWSGSLRGTFVNRKVFLERIDSKLGRSATFEGYLSTGGDRIRGGWTSYDLAAEGGSQGQWVATRQVAVP